VEQLAQLRVVSFGREPGEDIMKIVFFSLFARPILLVDVLGGRNRERSPNVWRRCDFGHRADGDQRIAV
jgi:hypothetical protein